MNPNRKITLGLVSLFSLTALGIFGTTAGTLAWYIYSRSTGFSFVGTSVAKSVLLNIGILDDNNYISDNMLNTYNLTRETHDGHSIVFTQSSGGLDYHVIQDYLFWTDYNSSMLFPVTTKSRTVIEQGPLTLYKSPDFGETGINIEAKKSDYVRIPFAFRVDNRTGGAAVNTDVWLTDSTIKASGKNIDQAVRICVENDQRRFIFKPADTSYVNGSTNVGGLLDLNKDGFYDFDADEKEMYYGEYNGTLTYNGRYTIDPADADYDNVNGVTYLHESTFYAKHLKDIYTANLTNVTPKTAEYYSFGNVKPLTDSNGDYYGTSTRGFKICATDGPTGVGYATFTIYIEGWDHVVIDDAAGYNFNLNLRFEMNRLQ